MHPLGDIIFHNRRATIYFLRDVDSDFEFIHGRVTCVVQPCVIRILKCNLEKLFAWAINREQYVAVHFASRNLNYSCTELMGGSWLAQNCLGWNISTCIFWKTFEMIISVRAINVLTMSLLYLVGPDTHPVATGLACCRSYRLVTTRENISCCTTELKNVETIEYLQS